MRKIYIKKRLVESQGVDDDIHMAAERLGRQIMEDSEDWEPGTFVGDYVVDLSCPEPYSDESYDYTVEVKVFPFERMTPGGSAQCHLEAWEYAKLIGKDRFRTLMNMEPPEHQFTIKVNSRRLPTYEHLVDILSHEMLHTKSAIRELAIRNRDHENKDSALIAKSNLIYPDTSKLNDSVSYLNFIRYMFSPTEMKSYVQGGYSFTKGRTERFIEKNHRAPNPDEIRRIMKSSTSWQYFVNSREEVENLGYEELDDFMNDFTYWLKINFKQQYGINGTEDLRKYFVKASKDMEQKLLKALYKGCMDAIEEYQNKNNTVMERRNIKRTSPKLYEGISYSALTPGGQRLMDRVVEGLRKAKDNLEMIIYGDQSNDEATTNELIDIHRDVCKMLDKLPW